MVMLYLKGVFRRVLIRLIRLFVLNPCGWIPQSRRNRVNLLSWTKVTWGVDEAGVVEPLTPLTATIGTDTGEGGIAVCREETMTSVLLPGLKMNASPLMVDNRGAELVLN
jgi:hypothetical protein